MKNPIERALVRARDSTVSFLCRRGIRPNLLTIIGLVLSTSAALGFATDRFIMAGVLLLAAGAFDVLDGQVAREAGKATRFGAFFDSVVDRYSDTVVFLGIMVNYLNRGRVAYALLTIVALVGALITSYSRARGEPLVRSYEAGYLKRPERVVLLIIGGLSRRMDLTLWVLAILSHLTVLQRIFFVWREIAELPATNTTEEGEPSTIEADVLPSEKPRGRASAFSLIYWDYPRNSWQFYLLSGIVLVVVFMSDLWGLFR